MSDKDPKWNLTILRNGHVRWKGSHITTFSRRLRFWAGVCKALLARHSLKGEETVLAETVVFTFSGLVRDSIDLVQNGQGHGYLRTEARW